MTRTSWCGQVMAPNDRDASRLVAQRGIEPVRAADDERVGGRRAVARLADLRRPLRARQRGAALVEQASFAPLGSCRQNRARLLGLPILGASRARPPRFRANRRRRRPDVRARSASRLK